jgi:hypothetical protein
MRLNGYDGGGGLAGWTYTGKHDPQALGQMLKSATLYGVPGKVASQLGIMLAPPDHWRGPRLKVIPPPAKRTLARYINNLLRMREIRNEYLRKKAAGVKHDAAIFDLKHEYGVRRTWITDAIALSDEKFIEAIANGAYRER